MDIVRLKHAVIDNFPLERQQNSLNMKGKMGAMNQFVKPLIKPHDAKNIPALDENGVLLQETLNLKIPWNKVFPAGNKRKILYGKMLRVLLNKSINQLDVCIKRVPDFSFFLGGTLDIGIHTFDIGQNFELLIYKILKRPHQLEKKIRILFKKFHDFASLVWFSVGLNDEISLLQIERALPLLEGPDRRRFNFVQIR